MKVVKLKVDNYRLLKNFSIDLEDDLSLVIGKNNTGKTSILQILDKFLNKLSDTGKFQFDDFNIEFKSDFKKRYLETKKEFTESEYKEVGISLKIFIEYNSEDNLENIHRVMMDLDPDNNVVVLYFGYTLDYNNYLKLRAEYGEFNKTEKEKKAKDKKYQCKDASYFLKNTYSNYFNTSKKTLEFDPSCKIENEENYIDLIREKIDISNIINFKFISAKREVANVDSDKTLSSQTAKIYTKSEVSDEQKEIINDFKDRLGEADVSLSTIYKKMFSSAIGKVKSFGGVKLNESEIEIISSIQHQRILDGNTTVVYRHDQENQLPEYYNGLGYMNLISMIFEIEILLQSFKKDKGTKPADINILFIEEPEAHTHPQMQYVFIKNIKNLLGEGIRRADGENRPLQYIISTHSSHIVADSDFDDIKYLKKIGNNNVVAKNLKELQKEYDEDTEQYQFLKQYLTINRAEIFFAEKAILIEGDTERILIPTMMKKVDLEEEVKHLSDGKKDDNLALLSQNISIIEVGAYAQIFEKFIEFLGIKSLIITDLDSVSESDVACRVAEGVSFSNTAVGHFLNSSSLDNIKKYSFKDKVLKFKDGAWIKSLDGNLCIAYQTEEEGYNGRSFEDAFIHINKDFVSTNRETFRSLKKTTMFDDESNDAYTLASECIKKKTHFALDVIFNSNDEFDNWFIPGYINEGLLWLKKD